jgi:hypothetical protein
MATVVASEFRRDHCAQVNNILARDQNITRVPSSARSDRLIDQHLARRNDRGPTARRHAGTEGEGEILARLGKLPPYLDRQLRS